MEGLLIKKTSWMLCRDELEEGSAALEAEMEEGRESGGREDGVCVYESSMQ